MGTAARSARMLALAVACALLAANAPVALVEANGEPRTAIFVYGESNARIAGGRLVNLANPQDNIEPRSYSTPSEIWLAALTPEVEAWSFGFAAPAGEVLVPGTYANAHKIITRPPGTPGIDVSGHGSGCNEMTGAFTIHEIEWDGSSLSRFSASFVQNCGQTGQTGATHGEIRFNSALPWAAWSMTTEPFSAFAFGNVVLNTTSAPNAVVVANSGTTSIELGASIVGSHPSQFGLLGTICLGVMAPGATCEFGVVFKPTIKAAREAQLAVSSSVYSAVRHLNLTGTGVHPSPLLAISQSPAAHYVGDPVTFTVSVDPVPDGGTVHLFYGDSEDRITTLLGSKPIGGANGGTATFNATFAPEVGFQMKAFYSGTDAYDASESATFIRSEIAPPNIWWIHKPNLWSHSATNEFAFKSLDDWYWQAAVSFQCKVDNGSWQTCTSPRTVGPLADGPHTFRVRGIDANGRVSEHPAEWEWRVDTQPPTLSVVANGGKPYTNRDLVRIELSAQDQWYVNNMIGFSKLVLDGDGVLANPYGYDQFRQSFEWPFTDPLQGGSSANGTKTVYFQVSDPFGHWSTVASASFIYDTKPPTVAAPTVALPTGKTSGSGIPVRVSWPAASDTRSGIAQYQLQRSTNGGPWALVGLSSDLARSYAGSLAKGNSYAFRVRARDGAGNWSAWVAGPTFRPVLRQEKNTAISYAGSWPRKSLAGAWGGYVKRAKAAGASASITFAGTAIGWVSTRAPKRGQARIYVDGVIDTTIDLYAASRSTRNLVWQKSWPTAASHTIEIRVVGTANRPKVDLDAFVLLAAP